MNPIVRNVVAVIVGLISGAIVNMAIIMISSSIIPIPEGIDNTTMEGLIAGMHLFEPKHFVMPFLAHAIGTLFGAMLVGIIAASHYYKLGLLIAVFFLVGGVINVYSLPSPLWFDVIDLFLAYLPMGYFGVLIAKRLKKKTNNI